MQGKKNQFVPNYMTIRNIKAANSILSPVILSTRENQITVIKSFEQTALPL